jgi:chitinase
MRALLTWIGLVIVGYCLLLKASFAVEIPEKIFVGYFESWAAPPSVDVDQILSDLPRELTMVNLAFMKPDASYEGGLSLSGTGLNFPYSGAVLKKSIDKLRGQNPHSKVLISIGGATYANWDKLNISAIEKFVSAFDIDGVDVDFEPPQPGCKPDAVKGIVCDSDALLLATMQKLRTGLPRKLISLTLPATAAYGVGPWARAKPIGGSTYGMAVGLLRHIAQTGTPDFDLINIMMYDAGREFDPITAYRAFRAKFTGPLTIGFTPPPEGWGGHAYEDNEVRSVLQRSMQAGANGAMLFGVRKGAANRPLNTFVDTIADVLWRGN